MNGHKASEKIRKIHTRNKKFANFPCRNYALKYIPGFVESEQEALSANKNWVTASFQHESQFDSIMKSVWLAVMRQI